MSLTLCLVFCTDKRALDTRSAWALQGDKVKKGQIVAYIEQLGTFVPVEVSCALCAKLQ